MENCVGQAAVTKEWSKGGIKHWLGKVGSLELRVCCLRAEEQINQMHAKQPPPWKHMERTYAALGTAGTHKPILA